MTRYKLTRNLYLDEYIPEALYKKYANRLHILVGLLDKELVKSDQLLRDKFGSVTINDWWTGGERNWSGIRTAKSPYYSHTSQHTYGRASDKIFRDASADKVREYIKKHYVELGISCIEDNVGWVHSDTRWWHGYELLIVKP